MLGGLTPYEYVARIWTEDSSRFKIDPYRHSLGPNTKFVHCWLVVGHRLP